jgi:hypothetical protein
MLPRGRKFGRGTQLGSKFEKVSLKKPNFSARPAGKFFCRELATRDNKSNKINIDYSLAKMFTSIEKNSCLYPMDFENFDKKIHTNKV